jgi:hypothetical protein
MPRREKRGKKEFERPLTLSSIPCVYKKKEKPDYSNLGCRGVEHASSPKEFPNSRSGCPTKKRYVDDHVGGRLGEASVCRGGELSRSEESVQEGRKTKKKKKPCLKRDRVQKAGGDVEGEGCISVDATVETRRRERRMRGRETKRRRGIEKRKNADTRGWRERGEACLMFVQTTVAAALILFCTEDSQTM